MLLAVLMIIGTFTAITTVQIFAAEETEGDTENEGANSDVVAPPTDADGIKQHYTEQIFATPEDKLKTMRLAFRNVELGYDLYVDDVSGEVACVNTVTGEKLFTNPYDVGASTGNETTKFELLSQIVVNFTDNQGQEKTFTSFEEAATRGQIVVENIKNGIRVEYTIGREQSKTLVPRLISKERFDEFILAPLLETFGDALYEDAETKEMQDIQGFLVYYSLFSKEKLDMTDKQKSIFGIVQDNLIASDRELTLKLKEYPVIDRMPVYVFSPKASEAEIARCEELILTYCPEYTYEELEYDHTLTEYESEDENPPVFRMALEYKIEADGLSVRLPANGIRFNESLYTLENIEILPYMGAGNSGYDGYNFFPDGSGTLFDFAELNDNTTRRIEGKVYGTDFAYHEISGTYQKPIRYPVFGIMEETYHYTYTKYDIDDPTKVVSEKTIAGNIVDTVKNYNEGNPSTVCKGTEGTLNTKFRETIYDKEAKETKIVDKRGFVAIIEEGDALAELATYHAGGLSDYNTIKISVTPRPKDSYNLQDSISVGANSDWTVVCDRKYVGTYKMKYIMLSDTPQSEFKMPEGKSATEYTTYDTSWFGMAIAYRDYLTVKGIIDPLKAEELKKDIPLYIETFGAVETTKKILSVPVDVMESLTTFDEVLEMYKYLSGEGIKNSNFKLTGYANGGMYYSVPGNLKFERVVGGKKGFQKLLDEAAKINAADKDSNLGIFPDFDLVYQLDDSIFDSYQQFYHAAKTIDDRYATRREYSATQQKYINYYEIVISPAYFDILYNGLEKNYANKYDNVTGISVSTLGQWLHSDFDEDEPYNREDSKEYTIEAFQNLDKTYGEVMTSGGNAYVWKYVDHMLDVSLDSSRYIFSSNAVPFIGVVLHGSVSFTGEPLNMEGDIQYAILKAIENGASPYFILSMDNTHILKEYFDLSQYYSIRYDIWKEDIADAYNTLNGVLSDVQDKYIIGHQFLENGFRIPDADELEADLYEEYLKELEAEKNAADILAAEIALSASAARENGKIAVEESAKALLLVLGYYKSFSNDKNGAIKIDERFFGYAKAAYVAYYNAMLGDDENAKKFTKTVLDAVTTYNIPSEYFEGVYNAMQDVIDGLENDLKVAQKAAMKAALVAELKTLFTDAEAAEIAENITNTVLSEEFTSTSVDDINTTVSGLIKEPENKDVLVETYLNDLLALILEEVAKIKAEIEEEKQEAETETETETETEEDKSAEYEARLASSIKSRLQRVLAGEKAGALADSIAKAIVGSDFTEADDNAIKDIVVAEIDKFVTDDEAAMGDIESALYKTYVTNLSNKSVYAYIRPEGGRIQISDLYTRYYNQINAGEVATAPVISDELNAFADVYMNTVAAKNAMQLLIKAGFSSDLGESKDKYVENYMADFAKYQNMYFAYEKNTNYYKVFKNLVASGEASDEINGWYEKYIEADTAKASVEKAIDNASKKRAKGTIDNYVEALAKKAAMAELGFENNEDAYSVTLNSDGEVISTVTKAQMYKDAVDQANGVRVTAIQSTVRLGSSNYSYIKQYYNSTLEHLAKAEAAIKVLANAEGETVEYAAGHEGEVKYITNYDSIKSMIVKQAIDRARTVLGYLENERFELIETGRETNLTLNGNKLRVSRDSNGNTYYFYGSEEFGYSYFTYDEKNQVFKVYEGFGSRFGGKVVEDGVEVDLFEYTNKVNGMTLYYTASVEKGFTYYVKNEYKNTYDKAGQLITYSGEEFRTLEDGTKIFYDANAGVYYSVNADGTYNRYSYSDSITNYYNNAVKESEQTMENVFDVIAGCKLENELDPGFKDAVANRMPKDDDNTDEGDEEKEEDTNSRYTTENIVAVTYGYAIGDPYKTIILNYNNYTINVVYDHTDDGIDNGIEYTIPAYEFVVIEHK